MLKTYYDPYGKILWPEPKFTLDEFMKLVKESGYDGVYVWDRPPFNDKPESIDFNEKEVLACAEKYDLELPVFAMTSIHKIVTLADSGAELEDLFGNVIKAMKKFGSRHIIVWPAPHEGQYREEGLDNFKSNLKRIIPIAKEHDITITTEFEKGVAIDNYKEGIALVDEVGEGTLKLTLDTHHVFNDKADPDLAVRELGDRLAEIHIKGSDQKGSVPVNDKDFDYKRMMRALKDTGWQGLFTSQFVYVDDPSDLKKCCDFMKGLLSEVEL